MAKETGTAVAVRQENLPMPIEGLTDVMTLGTMFEKSAMFGCDCPGQGAVIVLTCKMENITPMEYLRRYHTIKGRPAMRSDYMLAKFVERGGKYLVKEFSGKRVAAIFTKGENNLDMELTWDQAIAAGWPKDSKSGIKDNWKATPDAMLWARLTSKAIRVLDPGVNAGTYTPEEVADFDEDGKAGRARNVTADVTPLAAKPADAPVVTPEKVDVTVTTPAVEKPASKRNKATKAEKAPVIDVQATEVTDHAEQDYTVMPVGKHKGKPFSELETATLQAIMDNKPPSAEVLAAAKLTLEDEKASDDDKKRARVAVAQGSITHTHQAAVRVILEERAKTNVN